MSDCPALTHGDEGCALALFVTGDAGGARIKSRAAIHEKLVKVMTVGQFDAGEPPAIKAALHGEGVPMIEITHEVNLLRIGGGAKETNGAMDGGFDWRITGGCFLIDHIHKSSHVGLMLYFQCKTIHSPAWQAPRRQRFMRLYN